MKKEAYSIDKLRLFLKNDQLEISLKLNALKQIISMQEDGAPLVPELINMIKNNRYPEILSFVIEALGEIGSASKPAVHIIGNILENYKQHNSYDYIHNYAANSLGKIGSDQAVPFLINALKDPDSQGPCLPAIHALKGLREKAVSAVPILQDLRKNKAYSDYFPAIDTALNAITSGKSNKHMN